MIPDKKYTETELVSLIKQKDKAAFNYRYDNYSGTLFGIVLKILNQDEEISEDILQKVLLKSGKK